MALSPSTMVALDQAGERIVRIGRQAARDVLDRLFDEEGDAVKALLAMRDDVVAEVLDRERSGRPRRRI